MAYNNYGGNNQNRNGYQGNRGSGCSGGNGEDVSANQQAQQVEITAEELPENYVDEAEKVIKNLKKEDVISTSKLRNLFSLISDIYNEENLRTEETLLEKSKTALQMARIRFVYEAGRKSETKTFIQKAKLLNYIKWLGAENRREDLIAFFHYMEALVAYHRFSYGTKEER